ncbi:MAG: site-specific DNA-methyltransferase [Bacteroidales bacterium]|nr:site-specific DNA-methyltransferase [Bacteroidales bacterium]
MEIKRLERQSADGAELNLEALYRIAPSCFTEVADPATGELRHVVDFKVLRQLLGDNAVEDADEMYQFTWPGKQKARLEAARPIDKTLRPVPEDSLNWDTTQNLYIEGDNLEVLKLLQNSYMGKVKMIYIDPPYNTGNDFVYNDDFSQSADDYAQASGDIDDLGNRYRKNTDSNGRFHSDWCSMIYPRLLIARSLLSEDGAIFISADDYEIENLTKICNEIFGETNFIATIVWQRTYAPISLKKFFSENHEYCVVYCRNIECFQMNLLPRSEKQNKDYKNPDNDPRGPWKVGNLTVGPAVEKQIYPIIGPTGKTFYPPSGYCWRFSKEKLEEMRKDNRIWFGPEGKGSPTPKLFLSEVQDGVTPMTLWTYDEVGHGQEATRDLRDLMGKAVFTSPKPLRYISRFLTIGLGKDDIVLDYFSGSATTAHAVMQLNAKDGGNRKYILMQLPEETEDGSEARKAGYKNICEIGKERIRRAGKKIKEENPLMTQDLDVGFRVFRCDSSNFEDVKKSPQAFQQGSLDLLIDNVKADRTDLDLLFGAMLSWGVELSLPMETIDVNGMKIYNVNDGDLVACFAPDVTEEVINHMADLHPMRVLFRDSCFSRDDQKINLFETFKQRLDWSEETAINSIRVI